MKQLYFSTSDKWREWLKKNHDKEDVVWLIFHKKESGKPTLEYEDAVEEALCFGWIDSIIKKIDETSYVRKFTPRKETSKWSDLNKKRVVKLTKEKRMTAIGKAKIDAAKKNGSWDKPFRTEINFELPKELLTALNKNKKAKENFNQLSPTYQKHYIGWIVTAKRLETKERRIKESIALLEKGEKLGLK